jgi:hypothetical protein
MDRAMGVIGVATGGYVVVPEVISGISKKLDIAAPCVPNPSILMYDLVEGVYSHSFTFNDITIILATISSSVIAVISVYKIFKGEKKKRRKEDWIDEIVK